MPNKTIPTPEEIETLLKQEDLSQPENAAVVNDILAGLDDRQKRRALLSITHPFLSKSEIARRAGYIAGSHLTRKIEGKIGEILLNIGITEADIGQGLKDGMMAKRVSYHRIPIVESGKVVGYEVKKNVEPDYATRRAYLELIMKSHRKYMPGGRLTVKHELPTEVGRSLKQLRERDKQLTQQIPAEFQVVTN